MQDNNKTINIDINKQKECSGIRLNNKGSNVEVDKVKLFFLENGVLRIDASFHNVTEIEKIVLEILKNTNIQEFSIEYGMLESFPSIIEIIKSNPKISTVKILPYKFLIKKEYLREFHELVAFNVANIGCDIKRDGLLLNGEYSEENLKYIESIINFFDDFYCIHFKNYSLPELTKVLNLVKSKNSKIIIEDSEVEKINLPNQYSEDNERLNVINNVKRNNIKYKEIIKNIERKYIDIINDNDDVEFVIKSVKSNELYIKASELKEKKQILRLIVDEVKSKNLSPLEQYMYIYNIVKLFKEYKAEEAGQQDAISRKTEFILFNEYIVCVGYVNLLIDIIEMLDNPKIKVIEYACCVPKEKKVGHVRCLVQLNDEKYNVSGIYISDPTYDSLKFDKKGEVADYYNFFLLTKEEIDEVDLSAAADYFPDCTDVLFRKKSKYTEEEIPGYAWDEARNTINKFSCYNSEITENVTYNFEQKIISSETIKKVMKKIYLTIYPINKDKNKIKNYLNNLKFELMMSNVIEKNLRRNETFYEDNKFINQSNKK